MMHINLDEFYLLYYIIEGRIKKSPTIITALSFWTRISKQLDELLLFFICVENYAILRDEYLFCCCYIHWVFLSSFILYIYTLTEIFGL